MCLALDRAALVALGLWALSGAVDAVRRTPPLLVGRGPACCRLTYFTNGTIIAAVNTWAFLEHLHRVHRRLLERTGPLLREHGLATATLWMLAVVERHPYPSEIAREVGLPAPTVSRLLKGLEADGYLVRETVPEDLRRYRFRLTPAGRALHTEARRCMEETMAEMLGRLTPEECAELDRLLGALANVEVEPWQIRRV